MDFLNSLLPYLLPLCITLASLITFWRGYGQEARASADRLIMTLRAENENLTREGKVKDALIGRLTREDATVRYALKKRGITFTKNGDYITLIDTKSGATHTVPLRPAWDAPEGLGESMPPDRPTDGQENAS